MQLKRWKLGVLPSNVEGFLSNNMMLGMKEEDIIELDSSLVFVGLYNLHYYGDAKLLVSSASLAPTLTCLQ